MLIISTKKIFFDLYDEKQSVIGEVRKNYDTGRIVVVAVNLPTKMLSSKLRAEEMSM